MSYHDNKIGRLWTEVKDFKSMQFLKDIFKIKYRYDPIIICTKENGNWIGRIYFRKNHFFTDYNRNFKKGGNNYDRSR